MIVIDWRIDQMECNQAGLVTRVYWRAVGKDGDLVATVANAFDVPVGFADTTPYDQLTIEQVLGWVKDDLGTEGVQGVEDTLASDLAEQMERVVVPPPRR